MLREGGGMASLQETRATVWKPPEPDREIHTPLQPNLRLTSQVQIGGGTHFAFLLGSDN